jgi:hypothetical protein
MAARWLLGTLAATLIAGSTAATQHPANGGVAGAAADAGCTLADDLVVGSPAEDVGPLVDAGVVTVVYSGSEGFGSAGGVVLRQESVGELSEAGDGFGAAIEIVDVIGDACTDLIIGVPGEDDGTGEVVVIPGSTTGPKPADAVVLRQGLAGVAGTAEVGDAFGATLGGRTSRVTTRARRSVRAGSSRSRPAAYPARLSRVTPLVRASGWSSTRARRRAVAAAPW